MSVLHSVSSERRMQHVMIVLALAFVASSFAMNAIFARASVSPTPSWGVEMGPAAFSIIRVLSGGLVLGAWLVLSGHGLRHGSPKGGLWFSLYGLPYAFGFTLELAAAATLIQFVTAQMTVLAFLRLPGAFRARLPAWLFPHADNAPPLSLAAVTMICATLAALGGFVLIGRSGGAVGVGVLFALLAGVAWGFYTLSVTGSASSVDDVRASSALATNAGNFVWAMPFALIIGLPFAILGGEPMPNVNGLLVACVCGVVTSGIACSVFYALIEAFGATRAAVAQTLIPILAAIFAIPLLGEAMAPARWGMACLTLVFLFITLHAMRRQSA